MKDNAKSTLDRKPTVFLKYPLSERLGSLYFNTVSSVHTRQTSIHSASGQARSRSAIESRTALWSVPAAG